MSFKHRNSLKKNQGKIGRFSFPVLLMHLCSALGMLTIGTVVVDLFGILVLPNFSSKKFERHDEHEGNPHPKKEAKPATTEETKSKKEKEDESSAKEKKKKKKKNEKEKEEKIKDK